MRILALDVGDKRIGIALSDPFGWTAGGIETITRTSLNKDFERIQNHVLANQVEKIIVGLPLDTNGEVGPQAKKALKFKKGLEGFLRKRGLNVVFETWDESMTTIEAEEVLIGADVSRAKRKKVIDKLAAVMILKSYLESGQK